MESFADFDNAEILPPKAPVDEDGKPIERWAPLGANDSPDISVDENSSVSECGLSTKHQMFNEENEILNSSLLLLTSHFAQVQFRLEQVLQADPEEKETLLRDLEQFAWKGVPELHSLRLNQSEHQESVGGPQEVQQRTNVSLIIDQLKTQLHDLEEFAYKSGDIQQLPTQRIIEKQRLILEELGKHLGLNVSDFSALPEEEIRSRVNAGLIQLTNPIRVNEALVDQLKTQITDLERFIDFLHDEGTPDSAIGKALEAFRRYQEEQRNKISPNGQPQEDYIEGGYHIGLSRRRQGVKNSFDQSARSFASTGQHSANQKTMGLITRALTMLQVFATMQLASRRASMQQSEEKSSKSSIKQKYRSQTAEAKAHHWGDVRANLEVAIETVLEKAERLRQVRQEHYQRLQMSSDSSAASSTSLDGDIRLPGDGRVSVECCTPKLRDPECVKAERELNITVRRQFCPALEALIEHGSRLHVSKRNRTIYEPKPSFLSSLLSILGCFSRNRLEGLSYQKHFPGSTENEGEDFGEDDYEEETDEGSETEGERRRLSDIEAEEEKRARILRKRSAQSSAWAVFLKYYVLMNGRAFNDTPARKLSESFSLDLVGGKVVTAKQHLLSSMGTVLQEFNKYKRSEEAQFKALVCIGLNSHRLVSWMKLVLRSPLIVQYMYHPWSYVTSTGFDDALQSLNKLSLVDFNLPFDANIRHLQSINDAF